MVFPSICGIEIHRHLSAARYVSSLSPTGFNPCCLIKHPHTVPHERIGVVPCVALFAIQKPPVTSKSVQGPDIGSRMKREIGATNRCRPMAHVDYVPNSCLVSIYSRPMADLFLLRLTMSKSENAQL